MRFKNLTITLTLMCLSIVALAGLVLLPISNVICEVEELGWTPDEGTNASYYARKDVLNESWYLVGSVDARGVSASGSVGILAKDQYTESQDTIMGTAELSVQRNPYNWYHKWFIEFRCNNFEYDEYGYDIYCRGHTEPRVDDSNIMGAEGFKPFYDYTYDSEGNPVPRHTNIALKVKVREGTYKWISGRSKTTTSTARVKVKGSYKVVEGETEFTYQNQVYVVIGESAEYPQEKVINEADTSGHSVSVGFEEKASSFASASVSFGGASNSKTVEYSGQP